MRLTLRTMLAYMDDILEPDDAQRIGQKIKESEYATGLLQRTRDVMRRLRLAAPAVTDRSKGLDPNTVAEYLDNTLSDDRVPDFEKVCLESDIHLAEVASCHQILTLVLGQPAEVHSASRRRMYRLPRLLEEEAETETVQPVAPSGTATDAEPEPPAHPLCLDTSKINSTRTPAGKRKRLLPVAGLLVLVVLSAAVLLAVLGQFEPGTPIGDFIHSSSEEGGQLARGRDPAGKLGSSTPDAPDYAALSTASTGPRSDSPAKRAEPSELIQPAGIPDPDKQPATTAKADPAEKSPAGAEAPVAPLPDSRAVGPTADGPTQPDTARPQTEGAAADKSPSAPSKLAMLPGIQQPAAALVRTPDDSHAEAAPLPHGRLGQFICEESDDEVLLRLDPGSGTWQRVPVEMSLPPHHDLLAMPSFRPLIELISGVRLRLIGGTQVQLEPSDREGVAGLRVIYGRLLLQNTDEAKTRLRLRAGNRTGLIIFDEARSAVAVEVAGHLVPGTDPQTQPASLTVRLFAAGGRIIWKEATGGQPVVVEPSSWLNLEEQPPQSAPARDLPDWMVSDTLGVLERRASATLRQALRSDRPVKLELQELLAGHRQTEVRRLAGRCLDHIGEFTPMVVLLNDPGAKLVWPEYAQRLHVALARGPRQAGQVREAFLKEYGSEAADLFRMLCGFDEQRLRGGQAAALVEHLDHQSLAFRRLSFWNLRKITGKGLFYQPEAAPAKRRAPVREWRQRLEAGQFWPTPSEEKKRGSASVSPGLAPSESAE